MEIRRYDADTPARRRAVVIATLNDRLTRFLTAGDVDGDGKAGDGGGQPSAAGLWLLRPGEDPRAELPGAGDADRQATPPASSTPSILTDLDGDGVDELYVASDRHKEVRRYVPGTAAEFEREVIYKRPDKRPIFTWNLMPVPMSLVPDTSTGG